MSFLQNFIAGNQAGTQSRQTGQRKQIGQLAAMGNYAGARDMANQNGMMDIASQFQGLINQMSEQQRAQELAVSQRASQEALGILSMTDPKAQHRAIIDFGQRNGYEPEHIQEAINSPQLLMSVASGFEEYANALAANQKNFTLSNGQSRNMGASGQALATNANPNEIREFGDSLQVFDPDGGGITQAATRGPTHAESEITRSAQVGEANTRFSNQTGRMNAETNRQNVEVNQLNAETNQYKAENPTQTPRTFNEAQAKAANFASRAGAAHAELASIINDGFNPSGIRLAPLDRLSSQERRQYDRAQREFINAILRQESGAAIGKEEFANADRQYFPQFGDSEETMQRKTDARQRAIEGLSRQSQGASEALFGGNNAPSLNLTPNPDEALFGDESGGGQSRSSLYEKYGLE